MLDEIRTPRVSRPGVHLILGEPGSGKSTLLEEWHTRWLHTLGPPRLGARVPVFIRLRDVSTDDLAGTPDSMADRLWSGFGTVATAPFLRNGPWGAVYGELSLFSPVWLLDGLDEAPAPLSDQSFWQRLAALPG